MQATTVHATELCAALRQGLLSSHDVMQTTLDRISTDTHHAFQFIDADRALAEAGVRDRERAQGVPLPPLWGLPLAHKDNVNVAGFPTARGTAALPQHRASADDPIAARLREAGTVTLGKTQMSEFGLTGYSDNPIAPPTRNPLDPSRTAGGSSGGAAAAVALGLLPFAPGNDGGGSIRIPAAACGVIGLKAGRGAVHGDPSHPQALVASGVLARTPDDAALLWNAVAGQSGRHPGNLRSSDAVRASEKLRIGYSTASPFDATVDIQLDAETRTGFHTALQRLETQAHHLIEAPLRYAADYAETFETVWYASFAENAFTTQQREALGGFARYVYDRGTHLSPGAVRSAEQQLRKIGDATLRQWSEFDVILTPTVATVPPLLRTLEHVPVEDSFVRQCAWMPYTSIVNVTGLPAISVPVLRLNTGLCVSVQLIGRMGSEPQLLQLAREIAVPVPPLDNAIDPRGDKPSRGSME